MVFYSTKIVNHLSSSPNVHFEKGKFKKLFVAEKNYNLKFVFSSFQTRCVLPLKKILGLFFHGRSKLFKGEFFKTQLLCQLNHFASQMANFVQTDLVDLVGCDAGNRRVIFQVSLNSN